MKAKILVIISIICALTLCVVADSLFDNKAELNNVRQEVANLEFDLNSCKVIYNDLLNSKLEINKELAEKIELAQSLSLQIENLQNELALKEENEQVMQEEIDSLNEEIASLTEQLALANSQIEALKGQAGVIDDRILSYMAIISGSDYTGDFVIPEGVTTIKANAFTGLGNIKGKLVLPSTLQVIGKQAFYNTKISGELVIPNNVISIEESAFRGCVDLTDITLPNSLINISNYAFYGCSGFDSLVVPEGVNIIGDHAFYGCNNLETISLPSTLNNIGSMAFYDTAKNLTTIEINELNEIYSDFDSNAIIRKSDNALLFGCSSTIIPNNVKTLENYSFYNAAFVSINIPSSVITIGQKVFQNCDLLESIIIPDSVTSMGESVLSHCDNLKTAVIGNGVVKLDKSLFYECKSLNNIVLGSALQSIGSACFYKCTSLRSIYIPLSVTYICNASNEVKPFEGCSNYLKIYCGAVEKQEQWKSTWNYNSVNELNTFYGYTYAQYLEAIATE